MRHSPQRVQEALLAVLDRAEVRGEEAGEKLLADVETRMPELVRSAPDVPEAIRNVNLANTAYAYARCRDLAEGRSVQWSRGEPAQSAEFARFMARRGASLEQLVQFYRRAHGVHLELIQEEVIAAGLDEDAQALMLTGALRFNFDYFEHLIAVTTEAFKSELERLMPGHERRRVEAVTRVLAGESASSKELGYRLEGHHLALIVRGSSAEPAARSLAATTNRETLVVPSSNEVAWLWLGATKPFDRSAWEQLRAQPLPAGVRVAAGDSQPGADGFRLSHRQAQITARASSATAGPLVRYADVALIATVLDDEVARASFVELFLGGLAQPSARHATLRATLQAYFSAGQNAASAAAVLGVHEKTVRNRLRTVEEMLGHPLGKRRLELEVALRMVDRGAWSEGDA